MKRKVRTGGDLLCAGLEELGVRHVFGLPGTQTVVLFDALRRSRLRTVVPASELAAAFMANGSARTTGSLAVVTTIPGPGFTLALTGLAEALHDSAPLLHLVVRAEPVGRHAFQLQELDLEALARPVTKAFFRAERAGEIPATLSAAAATALSGEPGPVCLELAWSALAEDVDGPAAVSPLPGPSEPGDAAVEEARLLLAAARRPLLLVGGGAAGAALELIERLGCPVLATCSGRGVVPEDHPLAIPGDFGSGVGPEAARLVEGSDLVLVLGCKLGHNGTGGFALSLPPEKLLRVDASARVLAADYPARLAVQADSGRFLARLLADFSPAAPGWKPGEVAAWRECVAAERRAALSDPPVIAGGGEWGDLFGALRRALPRGAVLVTDSGLHQVLARTFFPVLAPRGLLAPADFQSMGFGLPAALGAALAVPDRPVVLVCGDGGLLLAGPELLTAVRENIDLTIVLLVDGHYGLIRRQQIELSGAPFGVDLPALDLPGLAAALGVRHVRLAAPFEEVIGRCLAAPGVRILEVPVRDSPALRRRRLRARAKEQVRQLLPPGLAGTVRRLRGG
ncbi:MAG TPA: thiamine pyrophosphate-binding protein [Thermoanaerobaculia bacterium]|nr:thiamine pyrophosphate-binding protein [Thermoanaerobaculia bacterium]